MADFETGRYRALVDRLAGDYSRVPQQLLEEQVAKAVEGTNLFGQVPTTMELIEVIAAENVSRIDRAMRGGADLSEESLEAGHDDGTHDNGRIAAGGS